MSDNEQLDNIRVVSAIADKEKVILYQENGEVITIKQGDTRLKTLMDKIIPITTRGEVAIISLETFNVYAEYQKKSSGFVKFFKVAKDKLANMIAGGAKEREVVLKPIEPTQTATPSIPAPVTPVPEAKAPQKVEEFTKPEPIKEARTNLARTVANKPTNPVPPVPARTMRHEDMKEMGSDDNVGNNETIIAVIGDVIIPNMEKVKPYIAHALKSNSTIGVENFLKRIAAIINKRRHSVEDLMKFLERGDLPLADDGSIIAYKVLRKRGNIYVDCHTQKVTQKVGSYVCVDESLVDLSRDAECSNGLHIARRGYIGGFSGDIVVLCKIDPEDVMVVPHRDANKVRVKGYHILFEISPEGFSLLKQNKPATDIPEVKQMLSQAITGNHIARTEQVLIQGQAGSNLLITQLDNKGNKLKTLTADDLKKGIAFDGKGGVVSETTAPIDPKELNKKINEELDKVSKEPVKSTKSLNLQHKPAIQKFISTFGGSYYEMAVFAEEAFNSGRNVYRALNGNPDYRAFINPLNENEFNATVAKIFMPVQISEAVDNPPTEKGKKIIKEALNQAPKKPEPKKAAKKPVEKAKPAPKATAPAKAEKAPAKAPVKAKAPSSSTPKAKTAVPVKESSTVAPAKKTSSKATATKTPDAPVASKPKTGTKETKPKPVMLPVQEQVMKLYKQGKSATEISKITGTPRGTISGWIKKFN